MGKRWTWWLAFAALLTLSMDFWNWNDDRLIWFMPSWIWFIFALTLALSAFFALFSKYEWGNE